MSERVSMDRLGYEAPIRLGTWQRITKCGAPRMLSYAWLILCLWMGMMALTLKGFWWALAVFGVWAAVQIGLALLTWWNTNWDKAFLARWRRRYKRVYLAG